MTINIIAHWLYVLVHEKEIVMKMPTIDLNLCWIVFSVIASIAHKFSYWIIGFAVSVVAINLSIHCKTFNHSQYLFTIWSFASVIYIVVLFVGLFGIPIVATLDYIERLNASNLNCDVVTTLLLYIFWYGLVFKLMMLPVYYTFVRIAEQ